MEPGFCANGRQSRQESRAALDAAHANKNDKWQIFQNKNHYTGILFDPDAIQAFKNSLQNLDMPISIYIFSLTDDTYSQEFEGLKQDITLCPVPESILKVYRRIYK